MEITVEYLPFLGYSRFVKIMGQILEHVCVCTLLQLTNNVWWYMIMYEYPIAQ